VAVHPAGRVAVHPAAATSFNSLKF